MYEMPLETIWEDLGYRTSYSVGILNSTNDNQFCIQASEKLHTTPTPPPPPLTFCETMGMYPFTLRLEPRQ